jgi:protein-disulfide isomerase
MTELDLSLPSDLPPDDDIWLDDNALNKAQKRARIFGFFVPLAFTLGLAAGFLLWGRQPEIPPVVANQPDPTAAVDQPAQQQAPQRYPVPIDDDPTLGSPDAPITIIEFSDYQCPYCTKWHLEVFPRLMGQYSGQIRFVYRDFPLVSIHPEAIPAAEAANCAGEQGDYWGFHEKLFDGGSSALGSEVYTRYAEELGLEMTSFTECIETHRYQAEVQADFDYAAQLGVRSTPTFFINGIPFVGAQPFEAFQQLIDAELAGEIP